MEDGLTEPGTSTVRFRIRDMDCAGCLSRIEGGVLKVDGVVGMAGSVIGRTITVEMDPERVTVEGLQKTVGRLGHLAEVDDGSQAERVAPTWATAEARIAYASILLFLVGLTLQIGGVTPELLTLPLHELRLPDLFFVLSALVGGWNFFPKGFLAARTLSLDMNFLMTVAIVGAVSIGEYVEAAAIAFLFALAELLESYSVDRARASVESLMDLAPDSAIALREGAEVTVRASDLVAGDVVVVRPGTGIPVDGTVVEGASAVDQSAITGESLPVEKVQGDDVFAGTIAADGYMLIEVTKLATESTLARVVQLVEEAEAGKAKTERIVERFARWYTPAIAIGAVLVVVIPTAAFGAPFVPWLIRGLTLLVIACPCALVISTPVAVVSGITAAARRGVLIKGGVHLEAVGNLRAIAIDKTGTLTVGHLAVLDVRVANRGSPEDVLLRAAAVEARSEHPVARAIVEAAGRQGLVPRFEVSGFSAQRGEGAVALLDGVSHFVGKPTSSSFPDVSVPADFTGNGNTVVAVADETRPLGWISLGDRARDQARAAVARLHEMGVSPIVMLTGDNPSSAERVAADVGVDEVRAGLLPHEKVEVLKELEAAYGPVAMVGDGVNDAPSLATASVGIAMGAAGSDAAIESADVALMGDDLTRLPYLYDLSRRSRSVIRQNITTALLVKAVLVVGVPLGMVSLITAVVVGDLGVSLAVTLNGLRLARVES